MKRILYTAAVICMSFLAAQCTKDIDELQEVEGQKVEIGESYMEMTPGGQVHMYLGISGGSDGATRTTIADASSSGIRAVSWKSGDKIYVVAPTGGCLGCLTAQNSGVMAAFEGTINSWSGTQTLHYYYVGSNNSIADKATSYNYSIASQDGTLSGIAANHQLMHASMAGMTAGSKKLLSLTMENLMAIGWFDLTTYSLFTGSSLTMEGAYNKATLNLASGELTPGAELADKGISLTNVGSDYYIALIPGSQTITFTDGTNTCSYLKARAITEGSLYTEDGEAIPVTMDYFEGDGTNTTNYGYSTLIKTAESAVIWAPVNCGIGYDSAYPYGKLYQWGRKYGLGYTGDATTPTITTYWTGANGNEDSNTFYKSGSGTTYTGDWIENGNNAYWNSGTESVPAKTTHDPCPTGWRVPTSTELNDLYGGNSSPTIETVGGQKGCYFNGQASCTSSTTGAKVFLLAAGYRDHDSGSADNRESCGRYWSSSVDDGKGGRLRFNSSDANMDYNYRAFGSSVRCVYDGNDEGVEIDGTIWATYNLGTDADHPYGLLYQWGRVYGQGCYDETYSPNEEDPTFSTTQASSYDDGNSSANSNVFYKVGKDVKWHKGTWSEVWATTSIADASNPCPDGWTLPTKDQLVNLKKHYKVGSKDGLNGVYFSGTQEYSESVPNIFVPFAGKRDYNGSMTYRGKESDTSDGGSVFLWACGCKSSEDNSLKFESRIGGAITFGYVGPNQGLSIRCVKE